MFAALLEAAGEYASYALVERAGTVPGGESAVWITQLSLPMAFGPILTYLWLVFPNGQLPSARWRPVAGYTVFALVAWTVAAMLVFTSIGYFIPLPNPLSLGFAIPMEPTGQILVAGILVGPAAVLCAAALMQRFRGSRGVERQQLKLVAYAGVIVVAAIFLLPVSAGRKPLEIAKQLALLALPLAAGIAMLRYRLYDIDVLIKRTLVYGLLTVMLGLVYVSTVLLSQEMLRGLTGGSDIAVAVSTLLVVALFQPVRTRVQALVDRRFYRARYDASRTIDAFSVRLRGDVDLDSVQADLIGVIRDTIHPAHASLWLRRPR